MNWLAHIFLAGGDPEDQIGGVLADVLTPRATAGLSPGVLRGMALHRSLDAHGDAHPAFLESCRRLARAGVGLRSLACGVAVDVLYDHVLASHWEEFCPAVALETFAQSFYDAAARHAGELTPAARTAFIRMAEEDWLSSYREIEGVRVTLQRIRARLSARAAEQSPLPAAVEVYQADSAGFEEDFRRFLPAAQAHAAAFLAEWKSTFAVAGEGAGE